MSHIFLDEGSCECCGKFSDEERRANDIDPTEVKIVSSKKLSPEEKKKMLDYICGKKDEYATIEKIELSLYALIADANEILKEVDDLREYVDTLSKLE
tara:strand:- start:1 stop:294 length:294 start_codon:yes stop_codon:yes gene_type:complete